MSSDRKKQWTKRRDAQPVSDLVSQFLDPLIERRAGMNMDLVGSWEDIVGSDHAARCRPEKLKWPRLPAGSDAFEPATLILACDGADSLFLQHETTAILSKVNDYFGFTAVGKIKLVQKPLSAPATTSSRSPRSARTTGASQPVLSAPDQERVAGLIEQVEDEALKQALQKLGQGVFSKGSSGRS